MLFPTEFLRTTLNLPDTALEDTGSQKMQWGEVRRIVFEYKEKFYITYYNEYAYSMYEAWHDKVFIDRQEAERKEVTVYKYYPIK